MIFFIFFTVVILAIVVFVVARYLWHNESTARTNFINYSIVFLVIVQVLLGLEIYLKYCFQQSDTWGHTLVSQKWFAKFWKPLNHYGYRDIEHPESQLKGKKVVFVVGDSFVAGHGIENPKDRFANVLQEELGVNWELIIIGSNGWDTAQEYEGVVSYPHVPEVIVLSYYINDILGAAAKHGFENPKPKMTQPPQFTYIINNSYLVNFVYWRLFRLTAMSPGYWEFLKSCYADQDVLSSHQEDLLKIVEFSKKNNVELICIVFPHLRKINESKEITSKVVNFLRNNGVTCIDLADEFKLSERNPSEIVINNFDTHASVKLNIEIGLMLKDYINKMVSVK